MRGVIGLGVRGGVVRGVTGGGARSEKGKRGPDPANLLMHVLTEHPRHRGSVRILSQLENDLPGNAASASSLSLFLLRSLLRSSVLWCSTSAGRMVGI